MSSKAHIEALGKRDDARALEQTVRVLRRRGVVVDGVSRAALCRTLLAVAAELQADAASALYSPVVDSIEARSIRIIIGIVRDSTLDATNNLQIFMESFERITNPEPDDPPSVKCTVDHAGWGVMIPDLP